VIRYLSELAAVSEGAGPLHRALPFIGDFLDRPDRVISRPPT
jgi:hypothetical protein